MIRVFADSYYYLALVNPGDEHHQRVVQESSVARVQSVTTAWVLTEVGNHLAATRHRSEFVNLLEAIAADENSMLVEATQELFERGAELYAERADKTWSLVDCISFLVMEDEGLQDALTGDHHFEQAGFNAIFSI